MSSVESEIVKSISIFYFLLPFLIIDYYNSNIIFSSLISNIYKLNTISYFLILNLGIVYIILNKISIELNIYWKINYVK